MSDKNSVVLAKEKSDRAYAKYMKTVRETLIPIGDILDFNNKFCKRVSNEQRYIINELELFLTNYAKGRKNE